MVISKEEHPDMHNGLEHLGNSPSVLIREIMDSFRLHIKRANYQSIIWNQATIPNISISPTDNGGMIDCEGHLVPQMMLLLPLLLMQHWLLHSVVARQILQPGDASVADDAFYCDNCNIRELNIEHSSSSSNADS